MSLQEQLSELKAQNMARIPEEAMAVIMADMEKLSTSDIVAKAPKTGDKLKDFSNEIIVPQKDSKERITIRVEPVSDHVSQNDMKNAVERFIEDFKYRVMFTPAVEIVEAGGLPRFEGKARRLIRQT